MTRSHEFQYRLPHRVGAGRPGSHAGSGLGSGGELVSHIRLYDRPDPRRLDLRASLRDLRGEWLVRLDRQRAVSPVHVVVDCSASMGFGRHKPKLHVVADFVEALGHSAFRVGDPVGMLAFDGDERPDLFVPASVNRGGGDIMARLLRGCEGSAGAEGLEAAVSHLAGRQGLVFLASDFHWPLDRLAAALDLLVRAHVVPVIVWDPAEIEPPERDGLMPLRDLESGTRRTLWMRSGLRTRWREAAGRRRAELDSFFTARGIRPFYLVGAFDGEAMTRYFFEAGT